MGIWRLPKHHHFSGGELLIVLGSATLDVFVFANKKRHHTCCWILDPRKIDVSLWDSISFHPDFFVTLNSMP